MLTVDRGLGVHARPRDVRTEYSFPALAQSPPNCHRNCSYYRKHSSLSRSPRNSEKPTGWGWYSGTPAICWSSPNSGTSLALCGVIDSTYPNKIFGMAVGTGPFTYEARFTLYRPDGRRHINRQCRENFADACVVEMKRLWGCSAMVWGGISHSVKSQLIVISDNVTAVRYRNEVLRPVSVLLCSNANWFYNMIMPRPT